MEGFGPRLGKRQVRSCAAQRWNVGRGGRRGHRPGTTKGCPSSSLLHGHRLDAPPMAGEARNARTRFRSRTKPSTPLFHRPPTSAPRTTRRCGPAAVARTRDARHEGVDFDRMCFADGTLPITTNTQANHNLLHEVRTASAHNELQQRHIPLPCAAAAAHAREHLVAQGYDAASPHTAPAPRAPGDEPGDHLRGWQRHAARACDERA